jgi:hypothetical protein
MVAVNFDWDELEDNIDEEYDDAGSTIAEYTTEPEHYGNVVSQRRSGQSTFLHCDGLGSALALTNAAGAVTDTNAYTAFGEVTEQTGSTGNPFQYIGRNGFYTDVTIGTINARRRVYSASLGQWLSVLPVGGGSRSLTAAAWSAPAPIRFGPQLAIRILLEAADGSADQPGKANCLDFVDTTLKSVPPSARCGVGMYGHDPREDKHMCWTANEYGGYKDVKCPLCSGGEIVDHVKKAKCCHLLISGHRGHLDSDPQKIVNYGGIVNFLCTNPNTGRLECPRDCPCPGPRTDRCLILPDEALEKALGKVFGSQCKECLIILHSCGSGLFAGPLLQMAKNSGCIVCGYAQEGCPMNDPAVPLNPERSKEYLCVNSEGKQVGGPQSPRACGEAKGDPGNVNRPKTICGK